LNHPPSSVSRRFGSCILVSVYKLARRKCTDTIHLIYGQFKLLAKLSHELGCSIPSSAQASTNLLELDRRWRHILEFDRRLIFDKRWFAGVFNVETELNF
jgi:hypothetical protein